MNTANKSLGLLTDQEFICDNCGAPLEMVGRWRLAWNERTLLLVPEECMHQCPSPIASLGHAGRAVAVSR